MRELNTRLRQSSHGFSLLEVLVALTITALFSIAVTKSQLGLMHAFRRTKGQAIDIQSLKQARATLFSLRSHLELFNSNQIEITLPTENDAVSASCVRKLLTDNNIANHRKAATRYRYYHCMLSLANPHTHSKTRYHEVYLWLP